LSKSFARTQAESACNSLRGEVLDLIHGTGAFAPLTTEERREQLRELGIPFEPDANAADAAAEFAIGTDLREEIESFDQLERLCRMADEIAEEPERWDAMA
jgi:hypothetical protein